MLHLTRRTLLASSTLLSAAAVGRPAWAQQFRAHYRDPGAPIEARVRDLLARMTLEEKVAQMRSLWFGKMAIVDEAGAFAPDKAAKALPHGIGQIARPGDTAGMSRFLVARFRPAHETVAFVNAVQQYLLENTRLGIPALFHEEAAHGYVGSGGTIFPIPLALGSTWDPGLVEQAFTVAAREARARGATVALSPVLDLGRDPRFGRVEEVFGEDPHLVGEMGVAAVRGLQGGTRPLGEDRVFATLKHFVHGTPQGGLNIAPADISERTLREVYLVPFRKVMDELDPAIVMPAYNEVQGVPAHANGELLQETGRRRLGFDGAYFSDYEGIANLATQHHIAEGPKEAAVLALNAGVDADLPDGQSYKHLAELVRSGDVSEAQIDAAVARILTLKFEAGLFENPYVDPQKAVSAVNTPADIALAREVAEKSLVLLKNDGLLPLDPNSDKKLAVIGPNAVDPLFGGYSGVNEQAVGILSGIRQAAGPNLQIDYAEGVRIISEETGSRGPIVREDPAANARRIAEAVRLAKGSDAVLLVVGDRPEVTREAVTEDAPGDRSTLGLFGDQDKLVDAILATGKPVVALLLNGRPLAINTLAEKANAIVEGWYLGQEGGNAFANALFGKVNPGGKLTMSFPRSVGELPVYYNRHPTADQNKYIEGRRAALYPFGHGLSYTTFELSPPRLTKDRIAIGETTMVEVDVTNTGQRAGDEVVQLYVRDDISSVPRPMLELKGFERVSLQPGETRTVRLPLSPDALAFWDIDMEWNVEPGTFTILTGDSSASIQETKLTVAG